MARKKTKNIYDEMFKQNVRKSKKRHTPKNIWDVVFYERFYGGDQEHELQNNS